MEPGLLVLSINNSLSNACRKVHPPSWRHSAVGNIAHVSGAIHWGSAKQGAAVLSVLHRHQSTRLPMDLSSSAGDTHPEMVLMCRRLDQAAAGRASTGRQQPRSWESFGNDSGQINGWGQDSALRASPARSPGRTSGRQHAQGSPSGRRSRSVP